MKEHDYAAVLEDMLTLEGTTFSQYTDAAYQYERVLHKHFDTIRHALRFAEKMMDCPSPQMLLEMMKILDGKKMHDTFDCVIAQALKELGE